MMATPIHRMRFERLSDGHFRGTCLKSGATVLHWPSYLRDGDVLSLWENEPPGGSECHRAYHKNVKTARAESTGSGR
jgi:hypothetical protein